MEDVQRGIREEQTEGEDSAIDRTSAMRAQCGPLCLVESAPRSPDPRLRSAKHNKRGIDMGFQQ